ncbi:17638_t:CDS:2 [Funneliformis geosporum]|nr:17638_t:CDS:2 [Funneliformis geosporum]
MEYADNGTHLFEEVFQRTWKDKYNWLTLYHEGIVHCDLCWRTLWEISSGHPPFRMEDEQYGNDLAMGISKDLREKVIPGTPKDYVQVYTEYWDCEPDKRQP